MVAMRTTPSLTLSYASDHPGDGTTDGVTDGAFCRGCASGSALSWREPAQPAAITLTVTATTMRAVAERLELRTPESLVMNDLPRQVANVDQGYGTVPAPLRPVFGLS
jgi:hypothetical protein